MSESNEIQKALSDVALIRQVFNQQNKNDSQITGITLKANLLLQAIALAGATLMLLIELFSGNMMSHFMILDAQNTIFSLIDIALLGLLLSGLLLCMYFIIWRASKHNNESLTEFINRNFSYMNNLSFVSDLLIKFVAVSLVILSGHAQWITPLFVLFTGDYLLQKRFFTIGTKTSMVLGLICLCVSALMFFNEIFLLVYALFIFVVICLTSIFRLVVRQKQLNELN
ncbi:MAG: hypothetical protein HRU38_17315 [Saccharospirillaceae bacterium]|nr:hypothetical protein [Pseudomonadales bacterium]NRB80398.1 hypothetical protein [Saccharospirillaceae bacterium]